MDTSDKFKINEWISAEILLNKELTDNEKSCLNYSIKSPQYS